jgi:hypothetical protein
VITGSRTLHYFYDIFMKAEWRQAFAVLMIWTGFLQGVAEEFELVEVL